MIFPKDFSTKIRDLRKEAGLKQSELGIAVGLSSDSISDIERGKALTSIDTLIDLARYFQVSIDWLLGLSEDKIVHKPSNTYVQIKPDKKGTI